MGVDIGVVVVLWDGCVTPAWHHERWLVNSDDKSCEETFIRIRPPGGYSDSSVSPLLQVVTSVP